MVTNLNGNIWKTLFLAILTANITGIGCWLTFGWDSVKHSEIDQIMATRAPYIHDKQRIEEHLENDDRRILRLENLIDERK